MELEIYECSKCLVKLGRSRIVKSFISIIPICQTLKIGKLGHLLWGSVDNVVGNVEYIVDV